MSKLGKRLIASAKEARRIAQNKANPKSLSGNIKRDYKVFEA